MRERSRTTAGVTPPPQGGRIAVRTSTTSPRISPRPGKVPSSPPTVSTDTTDRRPTTDSGDGMRIALVKQRISLTHGGSERYCVHLARGLRERGHDVTLIGIRVDDELDGEFPFVPVRVNWLSSWAKNRSFARNAGTAAREGAFDVVYGLGRSLGLDAVRVTERLQSHWVEVYYESPSLRRLQRWNPRHRALIELERTIYNAPTTRRIVTQSDVDRALVRRYYGVPDDRIHTIHNGTNLDRFRLDVRSEGPSLRREVGVPRDVPLISFVAHDFARKGLRIVLDAMARALVPDLHLLVVGNGDARRFAATARSLGLGDRVHFTGARRDIERCLAASDLVVLPTLYEPFPNVVIEAMACGTPAVTLPTTGAADLVECGETGYLASVESAVPEIAAALERFFLGTADDRVRMSAAAHRRVQQNTFDRVLDSTESLLRDVAAERLERPIAA